MKLFLICFVLLFFNVGIFAKNELNKIIESTERSEVSTPKKKRRRKVQMCQECGRPEPECECKGEGHGVEEKHHKEPSVGEKSSI